MAAVDDTVSAQVDGGSRFVGVDSQSASLGSDQPYPFIFEVFVESSCRIASASDAGNQVIGIIPPLFFEKLFFDLAADDRLEAGNHIGIGVWTDR